MEFQLKKIRKEKNISQEKIAKKINTTQSTISDYERGKTEPDLATLEKIANILGCTTDELIGRTWKKE